MARFVGAVVPIALAACGLFDTSGIGSGSGAASVGTGDATTDDGSTSVTRGGSSSEGSSGEAAPTSTGVDTTTDTSVDPDTLGPFTPGLPVFELNSTSHEIDPTLRGDQLEIIFASDRSSGYALWTAWRESVDDPWSDPQQLFDPSDPGEESSPEISHDGLVLTYSGDIGFAATFDLYVSERKNTEVPWTRGVAIDELSGPGGDFGAVMSLDSLEMYFCSTLGEDSNLQHTTRRDRESPWGRAIPVDELNTAGYECAPFIDLTGRWLLFTSDSLGGPGGYDLWVAERGFVDELAQPRPLEGVNTSADEFDGWLSPDLGTLWFAGGAGSDSELFVAVRE